MNEWEERILNGIKLNEVYGGPRRWIEVDLDDLKAMLAELVELREACGCRSCRAANSEIG